MDPWVNERLGSLVEVADYLQSDSTHHKRTQERAQGLIDAAHLCTATHELKFAAVHESGEASSRIRCAIEDDLKDFTKHNAYKIRLDGLRFVFQALPNAVLPRLKRTSALMEWLCSIVTYVPSQIVTNDSGTDISTLMSRAHPLRGKALAILALLLRHAKPLSEIKAEDTDVQEGPAILHERAAVHETNVALAVVFTLYLLPSLLLPEDHTSARVTSEAMETVLSINAQKSSPNSGLALIGSVLLHQCVEVIETLGEASSKHLAIFGHCGVVVLTYLTSQAALMAGLLNETLLPRVQVDLSKALAMAAESYTSGRIAPSVTCSTQTYSFALSDYDAEHMYLSKASCFLASQLELKFVSHDTNSNSPTVGPEHSRAMSITFEANIEKAAEMIAELVRSSTIQHDAYQAAFHGLVSIMRSISDNRSTNSTTVGGVTTVDRKGQVDGAAAISRLTIKLTQMFLADVTAGTDSAVPSVVRDAFAVRRLEARVGLLSSLWEVHKENAIDLQSSGAEGVKDINITAQGVQLLSLLPRLLKAGLNAFKSADSTPGQSKPTGDDLAEMRKACMDCRTGCIAAAQELFTHYSATPWILEHPDDYMQVCLSNLGGPTLLVPGYHVFKCASEDAALQSTSRTMYAIQAEKILMHMHAALQDCSKYSLNAALDIVRAVELLAEKHSSILLNKMFANSPESIDKTKDVESIATVLLRCYGMRSVPKGAAGSSAVKGGDGEEEEEPPMLTWRLAVLAALLASIKASTLLSSEPLRAVLGALVQLLVQDLQDILGATCNTSSAAATQEQRDSDEASSTQCTTSKMLSALKFGRKKRLTRRFGTAEVEHLQRAGEQCGVALIACLTRLTSVTTDAECMLTKSYPNSEDNHMLLVTTWLDKVQEAQRWQLIEREVALAAGQKDVASDSSLLDQVLQCKWQPPHWIAPLEQILHALCEVAGRPIVYDNDPLQQCLELDITKNVISALFRLYKSHEHVGGQKQIAPIAIEEQVKALEIKEYQGVHEHMKERWLSEMRDVARAAVRASGLLRLQHLQQVASTSESHKAANARAAMKKLVSHVGMVYTYAREVLLTLGECVDLWRLDFHPSSTITASDHNANKTVCAALFALLPAQLSEVNADNAQLRISDEILTHFSASSN